MSRRRAGIDYERGAKWYHPNTGEKLIAPRVADLIDTELSARMLTMIRPGDTVIILRANGTGMRGQEWTESRGRAVMFNSDQDCWVLNMGGAHGRPGIADAENLVNVIPEGRKIPILGYATAKAIPQLKCPIDRQKKPPAAGK